MNIIGVDPSVTRTGIAWNEGQRSFVSPKPVPGATTFDKADRIIRQTNDVFCRLKNAELVVMEDAARGSPHAFYVANFWWFLLCTLIDEGVPVALVSPSCLKGWMTGSGKATKDQMIEAAVSYFPNRKPANDDEADAIGLWAIGRQLCGQPVMVTPRKNLEYLKKVEWPKGVARV